MMPPSSHTIKQSAHRAIVSVPALNHIHGSSSGGTMCNGQTTNSSPTSSYAAALRKLAKKAGDPIIDPPKPLQNQENTQANIGGSHLTELSSSQNISSLSNSSHYKRPPPPPLIQSIHPSSQTSSGTTPPVITISPTPTNLVYNNNKGIDYSVNREPLHSSENNNMKNNYFDQNGEQSLSSSFNSPKDFPCVPQNTSQMRQSGIPSVAPSHLSEAIYSSSKSVGFHPYSRQTIPPENQSKTPTLPRNHSFSDKSIPYTQFHPGFYQSSAPSTTYRYNSEPVYVEPYPSLLRPSLHPSLVLPPQSSHHFSPSNHNQASPFAAQYNARDYMIPSNSSNTTHNQERMDEVQIGKITEADLKSADATSNSTNPTNHLVSGVNQTLKDRCPVSDSVNAHRMRYDNISPPADQSTPLSLKKVDGGEKEPKATSPYSVSQIISSKSNDAKSKGLPISQLPKERYKQQVQKSLQAQEVKLSNSIQEVPSDLSVKKPIVKHVQKKCHIESTEQSTVPTNEARVQQVNQMHALSQDYFRDQSSDIGSNRSALTSHYLPVRHVEPRRPNSEASLAMAKGLVNGNSVHENVYGNDKKAKKPPNIKKGVTNNLLKPIMTNRIWDAASHLEPSEQHQPELRDKRIFNPAFHDKVLSPSKPIIRSDVISNNFEPIDGLLQRYLAADNSVPILFSKLDRELKCLKEYRRYNRFNGSDQSDDDFTDIDEDEFEKHEEIRRYHLMTIMSGPPMKSPRDPEKNRFLQLFGLTTHRKRSNLETRKVRRQRRLMRRDIFPKSDSLVKNKSFKELLGKERLANDIVHSIEPARVNHVADDCKNYVHRSSLPEKLKFFQKLGLETNSNKPEEKKLSAENNSSEKNNSCDADSSRDRYSPISEISSGSSMTAINDIPERNEGSPLRKRSLEETDKTDDSIDTFSFNESASAISPKVLFKSSGDSSEFSSLSNTDEKSTTSSLASDLNIEKLLSQNFAQEFHDSVFKKTKEQQALKKASRSIGPQKEGCVFGQVDESLPPISLLNHSEFASQSSSIVSSSTLPSKANCSSNKSSETTCTTILGLNTPPSSTSSHHQPFKWPGIQAVMEAYERHYDLQKLEKDILSSQCQCLKLKNRELANLAESLRSRMCDLITSKKKLDNERQQRQYAIDNLKRCLKDIR